jgi:hypothetical protein
MLGAALAELFLAQPSGALLLEVDLDALGDRLVTRDTASGLDWLDLPLTLNRSYDDVVADIGRGLPADFRHATQDEVSTLFVSVGVGVPINASSAAYPGGVDLLNLLGCVGWLCGTSTEYLTGILALDSRDPPNPQALQMLVNHVQQNVNATLLGGLERNEALNESGHFLVRPIPDPTPAVLLGLGLTGLGAMARRVSRKDAPRHPASLGSPPSESRRRD